jgi:hypothetical protein
MLAFLFYIRKILISNPGYDTSNHNKGFVFLPRPGNKTLIQHSKSKSFLNGIFVADRTSLNITVIKI